MRLNKTIILSYFSVLISGYAFSEDFCKRDLKALTKVYNVNNKLAVETRQISNANFELNSIFIDIVHVIESESISANLLIKMISKDSEILFNPKVSDLLGIDEISQSILEVSGLKSVNELYLKLPYNERVSLKVRLSDMLANFFNDMSKETQEKTEYSPSYFFNYKLGFDSKVDRQLLTLDDPDGNFWFTYVKNFSDDQQIYDFSTDGNWALIGKKGTLDFKIYNVKKNEFQKINTRFEDHIHVNQMSVIKFLDDELILFHIANTSMVFIYDIYKNKQIKLFLDTNDYNNFRITHDGKYLIHESTSYIDYISGGSKYVGSYVSVVDLFDPNHKVVKIFKDETEEFNALKQTIISKDSKKVIAFSNTGIKYFDKDTGKVEEVVIKELQKVSTKKISSNYLESRNSFVTLIADNSESESVYYFYIVNLKNKKTKKINLSSLGVSEIDLYDESLLIHYDLESKKEYPAILNEVTNNLIVFDIDNLQTKVLISRDQSKTLEGHGDNLLNTKKNTAFLKSGYEFYIIDPVTLERKYNISKKFDVDADLRPFQIIEESDGMSFIFNPQATNQIQYHRFIDKKE